MNIAILLLSKAKAVESTSIDRLMQTARSRGHQIELILEADLLFLENGGSAEVRHHEHPLPEFDAIIVKSSFSEEPSLHTPTTEMLRRAGYKLVNGLPFETACKNKMTQRIKMMEQAIPMPSWAIARSTEQAARAAEMLGFPLIVKVAFGTHGKGVFYAENKETFLPIVDYLSVRDRNPVIIEKFIVEAGRKDLRAFVVGGKVIAAMEREAKVDDVRANAAIGGVGRSVELSKEEEQLAIKAAQAFDLEIAGVDMLRSHQGPLVIEVNANPGFEELERATGVDVAGAIIEYTEKP